MKLRDLEAAQMMAVCFVLICWSGQRSDTVIINESSLGKQHIIAKSRYNLITRPQFYFQIYYYRLLLSVLLKLL